MNGSRWIPAVAVTLLLCIAAAAPTPHGAAPPPQLQPTCDEFASAVSGDSSLVLPGGNELEQALPSGMSVAACSLRAIVRISVLGRIELREWDATTLAPDPQAIALRRTFFNGSNLLQVNGNLPSFSFVPPVVTSSL